MKYVETKVTVELICISCWEKTKENQINYIFCKNIVNAKCSMTLLELAESKLVKPKYDKD